MPGIVLGWLSTRKPNATLVFTWIRRSTPGAAKGMGGGVDFRIRDRFLWGYHARRRPFLELSHNGAMGVAVSRRRKRGAAGVFFPHCHARRSHEEDYAQQRPCHQGGLHRRATTMTTWKGALRGGIDRVVGIVVLPGRKGRRELFHVEGVNAVAPAPLAHRPYDDRISQFCEHR